MFLIKTFYCWIEIPGSRDRSSGDSGRWNSNVLQCTKFGALLSSLGGSVHPRAPNISIIILFTAF